MGGRVGSLASCVRWSSAAANYDGQFTGPAMKTTVPGPRSKVGVARAFILWSKLMCFLMM